MAESGTPKIRCWACYGSLAYLAGYCPVCNDTGFIEAGSQELATAPGLDSEGGLTVEKEKLLAGSKPEFFL